MAASSSSVYRRLKWLWLWLQALMLPLAAVHLGRHLALVGGASSQLPAALTGLLWMLGGTTALVLWIIAQSLLAMHRFPLTAPAAAQLVGGFLGQYAVLAWTGGTLAGAAFEAAYATLAALGGCALLLAGQSRRLARQGVAVPGGGRGGAGCALVLVLAGLWPLVALFPLVWAGVGGLPPLLRGANLAAVALNVALTVRTLSGFSIWGRPDADQGAYDEEWQHWAAPTVILLILSSVAALLVVAILRNF